MKVATSGLVLCFAVHSALGQWVQTSSPIGEYIMPMIIHGNSIFAGSLLYGIHRSDDGGLTWRFLNKNLPQDDFHPYCFASGGTTLYAGSYRGYLYKSTDNGESWTAANAGFPRIGVQGFNTVRSIAIGDSEIIAALDYGGIWRSYDKGGSWNKISAIEETFSVAINGGKLCAATARGFYFSADKGSTWRKCTSGLPDSATLKSLYCHTTALLGANDSGRIYSLNASDTIWRVIKGKLPGQVFGSAMRMRNDTFYAPVYGRGVFRTAGTDTSWAQLNSGLTDLYVCSFEIAGNYLLAGTRNKGLFRSVDNGDHWAQFGNGPASADVNSLAIAGDTLYAAVWGNGLQRSFDRGRTWVQVNSGLTNLNIYSLALYNSKIYASSYSGLYIYNIAAGIWSNSGIPAAEIGSVAIHKGLIVAGTIGYGIYVSSDNGSSWKRIQRGPNDSITSIVSNGTALFAATKRKGVFAATDNCSTWVATSSGITDTFVYQLAINGNHLVAISSRKDPLYNYPSSTWISSDGGSSWSACASPVKPDNVFSLSVIRNTMFASTHGGGICVSNDNGAHWFKGDSGLTLSHVRCTALYGDTLYAGTEAAGVWKRPLSDFSGIAPENHRNRETAVPGLLSGIDIVQQNHDHALCRFGLPQAAFVNLCVYDMSGRLVSVIANRYLEAGKHGFAWRTGGNAAGPFILRLKAGPKSLAKKILAY